MNITDKKRIASQARATWRQFKLQRELQRRRTRRNDQLDPPAFDPGAIIDPADGTLNKDIILAGQGLAVSIPAWANFVDIPGLSDTLELHWAPGHAPAEEDYVVADLQVYPGPMTEADFPKQVRIDDTFLHPDGPYTLRCHVMSWNGTAAQSLPVPLICDSTPPWGIVDPPEAVIPVEPITDDYLGANPNGVEWTLPDYAGYQVGDKVLYWYLNYLPADPLELPYLDADVTQPPMVLHVPTEDVRNVGDGGCYLVYMLVDKATNRSRFSVYARLAVALGALPANLQPPVVPQAADGLVSLDDAAAGVQVTIPAFDNWKPTDRILVTWGGTRLREETLGSHPVFPVPVRVPSDVLRATYGDSTGAMPTPVSYEIWRGDVPFGPQDTLVDVDFSVVGPEPDFPDLVNPGLSAPRVFGAVSNELNVLTRADGEQSAALRFDLYTPLNAGEIIDFYWNGTLVTEATYTVLEADVPGAEVEVTIPWTYIAAAGNHPELPVHYRIRGADSPNEQHSPTTRVDADAFTLTTPAPTFLNLFNGSILNCQSVDGVDNAILLSVPDLSEWLAAGDVVTVTWTPVANTTGEDILTDAIKTEQITLGDPEYPVTGFIWRVQPYDDHVAPLYDPGGPGSNTGRARGHYTFTVDGEEIRSATTENIAAMWTPTGACEWDGTPRR